MNLLMLFEQIKLIIVNTIKIVCTRTYIGGICRIYKTLKKKYSKNVFMNILFNCF